jgi:hypothetical protein
MHAAMGLPKRSVVGVEGLGKGAAWLTVVLICGFAGAIIAMIAVALQCCPVAHADAARPDGVCLPGWLLAASELVLICQQIMCL